jgi:hypothetical protein
MGSTNDGAKPRFYYQKQLGVMGTICWKTDTAEKIKNIQNQIHFQLPETTEKTGRIFNQELPPVLDIQGPWGWCKF